MIDGKIQIGWLLFHSPKAEGWRPGHAVREALAEILPAALPAFEWEFETIEREKIPATIGARALPLLEFAAHQKLLQEWDYVLVLTEEVLLGAGEEIMVGAVSSVLEASLLSLDPFLSDTDSNRIVTFQLHLLGRLFDLREADGGLMQIPQLRQAYGPPAFSPEQLEKIDAHLGEVADARIEEQAGRPRSAIAFTWESLKADPVGIFKDVLAYHPWKQPFRLAKLTASSVATMIILMMTAEVWEIGAQLPWSLLGALAVLAIVGATLLVYHGRQLSSLCRQFMRTEQNVRARIVLLLCLGCGMTSLYIVLWVVAFLVALAVPDAVHDGWLRQELGLDGMARFCAMVAGIGAAAASLGGNLEDPEDLKYELFVEETL